jgi:hypothetical protein
MSVIPGRIEDANYDVQLHIGESRAAFLLSNNLDIPDRCACAPSGMTVQAANDSFVMLATTVRLRPPALAA